RSPRVALRRPPVGSGVDGQEREGQRRTAPLPQRSGGITRDREEVRVEAAGASPPRRRIRTGPAAPRRSVCAPAAGACSPECSPPSFLRGVPMFRAFPFRSPFSGTRRRKAARRPAVRALAVELLEDRSLPSLFGPQTSFAAGSGPIS